MEELLKIDRKIRTIIETLDCYTITVRTVQDLIASAYELAVEIRIINEIIMSSVYKEGRLLTLKALVKTVGTSDITQTVQFNDEFVWRWLTALVEIIHHEQVDVKGKN